MHLPICRVRHQFIFLRIYFDEQEKSISVCRKYFSFLKQFLREYEINYPHYSHSPCLLQSTFMPISHQLYAQSPVQYDIKRCIISMIVVVCVHTIFTMLQHYYEHEVPSCLLSTIYHPREYNVRLPLYHQRVCKTPSVIAFLPYLSAVLPEKVGGFRMLFKSFFFNCHYDFSYGHNSIYVFCSNREEISCQHTFIFFTFNKI